MGEGCGEDTGQRRQHGKQGGVVRGNRMVRGVGQCPIREHKETRNTLWSPPAPRQATVEGSHKHAKPIPETSPPATFPNQERPQRPTHPPEKAATTCKEH